MEGDKTEEIPDFRNMYVLQIRDLFCFSGQITTLSGGARDGFGYSASLVVPANGLLVLVPGS